MARPKKPETPTDPLVSVRSLYYEFLKHLDTTKVNRKAADALVEQTNKHKNAEKLWQGLAAYRDLRGNKSLLMHAVHSSCQSLYTELVKHGAELNVVDRSGRTLGHYAASGDNGQFVVMAVTDFPSSDVLYAVDDFGQRPIDLAKMAGSREFIREFELADAEVTSRSKHLVDSILSTISKEPRDALAALQAAMRRIK